MTNTTTPTPPVLVTGASGHLGRLIIDALLARGAAPSDIVAAARDTAKVADLAASGIRTVAFDYDRPDTITAALDGVASVMLVSGAPGDRVAQHRRVIDAAVATGVSRIAYTSVTQATTSAFVLAADHKATEEDIAASGIPAVILRNNWYTENYASTLGQAAQTGLLVASAGQGKVASASRADYAEAAAVTLLDDSHLGKVYELGGDIAWNYTELAAAMTDVLGRPVTYTPLTPAEHEKTLRDAGLPADVAGILAAIDAGIADGGLAYTDGALARLISHPTTRLRDGLRRLHQA